MSRLELLKELSKVNKAIDKKILAGQKYIELAKRHKRIVNLLLQGQYEV